MAVAKLAENLFNLGHIVHVVTLVSLVLFYKSSLFSIYLYPLLLTLHPARCLHFLYPHHGSDSLPLLIRPTGSSYKVTEELIAS